MILLDCPTCAEAVALFRRWLAGGPSPQVYRDGEHVHPSAVVGMILGGEEVRELARAAVREAAGEAYRDGLAEGTRRLEEAALPVRRLTAVESADLTAQREGGFQSVGFLLGDAPPTIDVTAEAAEVEFCAAEARAVAPWPDYAGQPIQDGDIIRHPSGDEGRVIYLASEERESDRWRVDYGEGPDTPYSFLQLQIGPMGMAEVKRRER